MCSDFKNVSDAAVPMVLYCQLRSIKLPISTSLEIPRFRFELAELETKSVGIYNNDLELWWLTTGGGEYEDINTVQRGENNILLLLRFVLIRF